MHTERQKFTSSRKYAVKMTARRETRKMGENPVHTHVNAKKRVSRARELRRKAFSRQLRMKTISATGLLAGGWSPGTP